MLCCASCLWTTPTCLTGYVGYRFQGMQFRFVQMYAQDSGQLRPRIALLVARIHRATWEQASHVLTDATKPFHLLPWMPCISWRLSVDFGPPIASYRTLVPLLRSLQLYLAHACRDVRNEESSFALWFWFSGVLSLLRPAKYKSTRLPASRGDSDSVFLAISAARIKFTRKKPTGGFSIPT